MAGCCKNRMQHTSTSWGKNANVLASSLTILLLAKMLWKWEVCNVCCKYLWPEFNVAHSFFSLSNDRSVASSKRVIHRVRSGASSFNFHYSVVSVKSSSSCLRLLPRPPVTCIPFIFLTIMCFRRQFLCKMWSGQLAFLLFVVCRTFLSSSTLCLRFTHDRSNWSSPAFSSTTFQNFSDISELFSEESKFQHYTVLCSKCST